MRVAIIGREAFPRHVRRRLIGRRHFALVQVRSRLGGLDLALARSDALVGALPRRRRRGECRPGGLQLAAQPRRGRLAAILAEGSRKAQERFNVEK